jgi:hypothetical protein
MTAPKPPADPSRVIAVLARDQVNLDLKTVDLCFLAGLYLRADKGRSLRSKKTGSSTEQVCDVVEPGAQNPRRKGTRSCAAECTSGARISGRHAEQSATLFDCLVARAFAGALEILVMPPVQVETFKAITAGRRLDASSTAQPSRSGRVS